LGEGRPVGELAFPLSVRTVDGPMHGVSAGVTFHLPHLELGVAAMYTLAAADVGEVDADSPNGTPGRYESNAGVLSLSATYRL
jgi:hypothetical protein